ncbi:MAG TPA: AraC family transcriptional regulator [Alphaproteobacteria bacterium]|nr:AraC family transcriptional regulator [Alphaproteobacteria bacterium]
MARRSRPSRSGPAAALPLARHVSVLTRDAATANAQISKIFAPHRTVPGGGKRFLARHHHARLAGLSFNYFQFRPRVTITARPTTWYYLLLIPQQGRCRVECGGPSVEVAPGTVSVVNPVAPLTMEWLDDCAQVVVKFDRAALEAALAARLGRAVARPILFDVARPTPVADCRPLIRFVDFALDVLDGERPADLPEEPFEQLFLSLMLTELRHSEREALARPRPRPRAVPYYVKRVEEFVNLHAERPISLDDMVAVSGVSARSLFHGFRAFRNMGPMAYLKRVRLERVRAELAAPARGGRRRVTDVATAWGFAHLGNFAKDYKKQFGESPSVTLRRSGE